MARPATPTGRPRVSRVRLVFNTGIEPVRQFWEYFCGIRLSLRQEYLRRCLILGFRFGQSSETPLWQRQKPDPKGEIFRATIFILKDDPDLSEILEHYASVWADRSMWLLKTALAGHQILSGQEDRNPESGATTSEDPGHKTDHPPEPREDILGGLYS